MRGEVIGVNSQIATSTGDYNGIGFALPSNIASTVFRSITSEGKVRRGYLGVYLDQVRAEFARVYGLSDAKGAIIRDMAAEKGPAAKAGLQTNDIVVEFNGAQIASAQDLINRVASTPVGETIQLGYLREVNNKLERRTASVTVGERPTGPARTGNEPDEEEKPKTVKPGAKEQSSGDRPALGLKVSDLTPQIANERNLKGLRGVVVQEVEQAGLAADAGLLRHMVIQRVNRTPVASLEEFERIINALKPGDPVVMHVSRYNGERITQSILQFTFQ